MLAAATLALSACTPAPDLAWQPPVRAAVTSFDEAAGDVAGGRAEPVCSLDDGLRVQQLALDAFKYYSGRA